jgi:gliding motility-associated-like protein
MRSSMKIMKFGLLGLLMGWFLWPQQMKAQCVKPTFLQTITVTNPNAVALTNYVVKMTINTTALNPAKLSNKFGFVFYDSDCVTQLNYWASDASAFPTAAAVYYVKIPSIPASSSKQIVMYYDNATTCTQLIQNTFSSVGTVATAPTVGFSAATTWELTNYTIPVNATTFRWDVRSANAGNFRPKTTYNVSGTQYVQAEGTSRAVVIGTNNYVDELPVDALGHPAFFTPTLLNIAQNTGLNQNVNSGSGDIPPNSAPLTANVANTAQVQVWYRPRATAEPTTAFGAEFSRTTPVTITPAGAVTACEEDILNFTASGPYINYRWYLDNIFRSSGAATTQSINTSGFTSGVHVLKVVAFSSACDSVQATKNITINPRPDINSLNPDNGCQFSLLNYSANVGLNGSTISTYAWDFGDATTGSGATPTHIYSVAANLNLRLIVTTTQGCKDTLSEPIAVYPKPTINTVTETDICWPNAVLYSNNTTIPSNWNTSTITTFEWRYGDGNNGFGSNSSHAFALPNNYTESLLVTTNVGCRDTLTGSVNVWPKPDITAITDPDICWPQAASFSNVTGIPNNWNAATIPTFTWHFGDATTGIGSSTTHAYAIPAFYRDSLYVVSSDGCRDTMAQTVSIWPKPDIDSVTVQDKCWPNGTTFTDYHHIANNWNSAAVTIYDWRFGDATTGNTNPVSHTYALPNVYTHTLYVQTGNACRDTLVDQVNIWPKPSINSLTETDICWPNLVNFTNNTTIPNNWDATTIAQWDWRFGDGLSGATPTLSHAYAVPNRYFDTLYVRTGDNCRDTLTGSVDVYPKPQIDSIIAADVCDPQTVNFTQATVILNNWDNATIPTYQWDFGDGNTATGASTTHQYAIPGAYNVRLIVVTSDGCRDTLFKNVNVYPKPQAVFAVSEICYGDSLLLFSGSTVSPVLSSVIADNFWTFGDGDSSHAVNPGHFYSFDGLYTVTLVTTTNHGCKDTLVSPINVFPKPNASFSFPRTCQPDAVNFIDASTVSTGTIANYDWAFGDGATSTAQNPVYAYATADSYLVELIVTTDQGCLDTLERELVWNPKPAANFSFQNVCFPDSTRFIDLSSLPFGNISRWEWDFGDGGTSLLVNPLHEYAAAGSYTVQLIVTSDSLCMDTLVLTTTSNEKPQAEYSPSTICWPESVPFQDLSTIGGGAQIAGWQWAFGDGDTATVQNPLHYYPYPDTFDLHFVVWSDSGCTDTLVQPFVAFPRPGLQLGPDTLWLCPFNTVTLHAGAQFVSYSWQDGAADSVYVVDVAGIYSVTVVDTNGCVQSDTVETPLAPKPVLTVTPGDTVEFCGDTEVIVDAATATILAYNWSTGATSSDITVNASGSYTVIGWNQYECSDTLTVVAIENALPLPDLGADRSICRGDTAVIDAGAYPNYLWSNGATTQSINVWYSGPFAVTVTTDDGCVGSDVIEVVRHELPYVNLAPDRSLCQGEQLVLDAGPGYANYFWPASGETTQAVTVTTEGLVTVIVIDQFGCQSESGAVSITVNPLPAPAIITKGDEEVELVATFQAQYQWYYDGQILNGATNQSVIPAGSGNYQVMVTDGNGCSMLSGVFHIDLDIYDEEMYEGISPNGDGVNDRFTVPEIEYYPQNHLQIFNRWGSEVYTAQPYLNEFDGHDDQGRTLPDGTYFYVLDLGIDQKPIKGYFVINR